MRLLDGEKTETVDAGDVEKFFDIRDFAVELFEKSDRKNRLGLSKNITGRDLAEKCILEVLYRLRQTPVPSFADVWLPVMMRSVIGSGIHEFLYLSDQFTEKEVSVRVPSLRFSGVIDALIGSSVLAEIKGCSFVDYEKIVKSRKPRVKDFLQALIYRYMLMNHLEEARLQTAVRTSPPRLSRYDIRYIQLIYVAHDIVGADIEDASQALSLIRELKRTLNSKKNQFYFITSMVIDLSKANFRRHENHLLGKLKEINIHLDNNTMPGSDSPFIVRQCHFCFYRQVCFLVNNSQKATHHVSTHGSSTDQRDAEAPDLCLPGSL